MTQEDIDRINRIFQDMRSHVAGFYKPYAADQLDEAATDVVLTNTSIGRPSGYAIRHIPHGGTVYEIGKEKEVQAACEAFALRIQERLELKVKIAFWKAGMSKDE